VSYNATTFYDRGRTLQGVFAAARDVSERKEDEAQLRFLMRELFHRSKNLLAVIQAMARQTARYSGSTESFLEKFNARLQALAMSHDILFKAEGQSASLADLVGQQLAPYLDRREPQVSVEGPTALLTPNAAQNLGFALHELASNAAKYGALSVPEGRVSIAWRLLPEADGNGVDLDWVESGGPAVVKPAHRGFGSMVIERNLARELDTQVELAFRAEGCTAKSCFPQGSSRPSAENRSGRLQNQCLARPFFLAIRSPLKRVDLSHHHRLRSCSHNRAISSLRRPMLKNVHRSSSSSGSRRSELKNKQLNLCLSLIRINYQSI
jgi:two-component sensor histidine kinase